MLLVQNYRLTKEIIIEVQIRLQTIIVLERIIEVF